MARKVSKALLGPFLKLIHPDVLSNAPLDIRISNSTTLRSLNHYFDEVQQGHSVSAQSLHFYLPQSDHYSQVHYRLPSFSGSTQASHSDLHLKMTINGLVETCKPKIDQEEAREMDDPGSKEAEKAFYEGMIVKRAAEMARKERRMQAKAALEGEMERKQAEMGLSGGRRDPVLRSILTKSLRFSLFHRLESLQIPTQFLFFSPSLSDFQLRTALLSLSEGLYRTAGGPEEALSMFQGLFAGKSPTPLYIATRYSVTALPGYLQVPWELEMREMVEFYREHKGEMAGRLRDVSTKQYEKHAKGVREARTRVVSEQIVASVSLGRDHCPSEEAYTAITFQASLELLTRLESFFAPLDLLAPFRVIIAPKTKRTASDTLELAPNESKAAIEALVKQPFSS